MDRINEKLANVLGSMGIAALAIAMLLVPYSDLNAATSSGCKKVCITNVVLDPNGNVLSCSCLDVKRKGSFWLLSTEGDTDNPIESNSNQCFGLNSKYAFRLAKSKNGKSWVIHEITEVTPDLDENDLFNMEWVSVQGKGLRAAVNSTFDSFDRSNVSVPLFSGVVVGETSDGSSVEYADWRGRIEPWKIAELPGFRLLSISTEGPRQNTLIVNFKYEAMNVEGKKLGDVNCQMGFDIEAMCRPIQSHHVLQLEGEETILDWSNTLTQVKERKYELKTSTQLRKKIKSTVMLLEDTKQETVFSSDDLPEKDFTVSAFGLPEPPGIEWKKPFPWYLVFASIGTACLGVFFFLRARGRRLRGC